MLLVQPGQSGEETMRVPSNISGKESCIAMLLLTTSIALPNEFHKLIKKWIEHVMQKKTLELSQRLEVEASTTGYNHGNFNRVLYCSLALQISCQGNSMCCPDHGLGKET